MGILGANTFQPRSSVIRAKALRARGVAVLKNPGRGKRYSPDLGRGIGTARWFGELTVLVGLIAMTSPFWPGGPLSAPTFAIPEVAALGSLARKEPDMRGVAARDILVPPAHAAEKINADLGLKLRPGETLTALLRRAGVRGEDASRADEMVGAALFPRAVAVGTGVTVALAPASDAAGYRALEQLQIRPALDLELIVRREGLQLVRIARPIPVETKTLRMRGALGADVGTSLAAAGVPTEGIRKFLDATDDHALPPVAPTSRSFDMIVTAQRAADGKTQFGDLLYAAIFQKQQAELELLRWGSDGQLKSARSAASMAMRGSSEVWPVDGRFTSGFGVRFHPILGFARMHSGIDIGAPSGTPIHAVSGGTVSFAGRRGGHGNYVRLEHSDGHGTGYAHLRNIAVFPGERISSGQILGYVGSTGLSTGPHLHFEVYRNGRNVDPMKQQAGVERGQTTSRAQFQAAVEALKSISPLE